MQLVERGATPKGEAAGQVGNAEEFDQCPTDDKILLYLRVVRPGRAGTPGRDVVPGDHSSGSMSTFTMSLQFASRSAPTLVAARRKGV